MKAEPTMDEGRTMNDGLVILGTVALVGLVAIVTVALVYDRRLWLRGSDSRIEVQTGESSKPADVAGTMNTPTQ